MTSNKADFQMKWCTCFDLQWKLEAKQIFVHKGQSPSRLIGKYMSKLHGIKATVCKLINRKEARGCLGFNASHSFKLDLLSLLA